VQLAGPVGLLGLLALGACATRPKVTGNQGPFLSIVERDSGMASGAALAPGAVALALGGLPPGELPRLREYLAEATDGALRRAAPELFDLEGSPESGPAVDPLHNVLPDLTALTAAANALGSPWEAPGISVHLGAACEPAASRCTPLFARTAIEGEALVRRGRALAWALGNAALIRVPATRRDDVLRALHEAQLRPSGTLSMVFGTARGALDASELALLRREARRALERLRPDAPQRPWLEAIDGAHAEWELPIALDADEVLVVPRLGALARLQDFASEVESAGTLEWVSPGHELRR
jgi:hypothetical protein